jgi:hypothetical protein
MKNELNIQTEIAAFTAKQIYEKGVLSAYQIPETGSLALFLPVPELKRICSQPHTPDQAQSTAQPAPTEMTASEIKAAIDRILMLFDNSHKDHSHREFAYIQDYKSLIKKDLESLLTQPKEGE